jgi:hypothetical protein
MPFRQDCPDYRYKVPAREKAPTERLTIQAEYLLVKDVTVLLCGCRYWYRPVPDDIASPGTYSTVLVCSATTTVYKLKVEMSNVRPANRKRPSRHFTSRRRHIQQLGAQTFTSHYSVRSHYSSVGFSQLKAEEQTSDL